MTVPVVLPTRKVLPDTMLLHIVYIHSRAIPFIFTDCSNAFEDVDKCRAAPRIFPLSNFDVGTTREVEQRRGAL